MPLPSPAPVRIDYLADHPDAIPLLAAWHHTEWQHLLPGWTLSQAEADLRSHTARRQIPTTLVAIVSEQVIGSASLLTGDLDGWEHLSPWLASVYVAPEWRRAAIGRRLVSRAVEEAGALGVEMLYLWTAGQEAYYARLGWEVFTRTRQQGRELVIMRLPTR